MFGFGSVSVAVNRGGRVIESVSSTVFGLLLSFGPWGWVGCVNSWVPLLFLMAKG